MCRVAQKIAETAQQIQAGPEKTAPIPQTSLASAALSIANPDATLDADSESLLIIYPRAKLEPAIDTMRQ